MRHSIFAITIVALSLVGCQTVHTPREGGH